MSQFGFRVGFSNVFPAMVSAVNYFLPLWFLSLPANLRFMSSWSLFFRLSLTLARNNNLEFEHERETSKRNSIRRQGIVLDPSSLQLLWHLEVVFWLLLSWFVYLLLDVGEKLKSLRPVFLCLGLVVPGSSCREIEERVASFLDSIRVLEVDSWRLLFMGIPWSHTLFFEPTRFALPL